MSTLSKVSGSPPCPITDPELRPAPPHVRFVERRIAGATRYLRMRAASSADGRSRVSTLIETVTDLPAGTLGFRASRKISSDEYRQMMEPIYAALERGEKLRIYFELAEDFHGLDSGALWQDWVRHGVSAFGWLAPGELRLFEPSEREEACAWLGATWSP